MPVVSTCVPMGRGMGHGDGNTLSEHLKSIGFVRGRGHPSVFHHPGKMMNTMLHCDDPFPCGKSTLSRPVVHGP